MKYLPWLCLLISTPIYPFASIPDTLVCGSDSDYNRKGGIAMAMSCVSKASIERDQLEVKKLKLEIEKMEAERGPRKKEIVESKPKKPIISSARKVIK